MLKQQNFGDVWNDDLLLQKIISPKWIIPLRFICKIPFGFFGSKGKKTWKQFDINFLNILPVYLIHGICLVILGLLKIFLKSQKQYFMAK